MTPRYLMAALALVLVPLAACEAPTSPAGTDTASPAFSRGSEQGAASGAVTVPFRVTAFTLLESLAPDPRCGEPPRFLNVQVGEGQGTHIGRFDIRFEFCVDATDLLDDGVLTEGESVPYDNGVGIIAAANGDELYLEVEGAVLPSRDPDFDFQFQDRFDFTGGTGRFAGARGWGMTDSYVVQETNRTDHLLTGRLVLQRGR